MTQGRGLPHGRVGALLSLMLLIVGLVAMHSMVIASCASAEGHHAAPTMAAHHEAASAAEVAQAGSPEGTPVLRAAIGSCGPADAMSMCLAILLGLFVLALLNRHVRPPRWRGLPDHRDRSPDGLLVPDSLLVRLGVLRL